MKQDAQHRAQLSLEGLSVADAFGEQLLHAGAHARVEALSDRRPPAAKRWMWTDDTAMAISIVEVLRAKQGIDPQELAAAFARRYVADPARGYGRGAHEVLAEISNGSESAKSHYVFSPASSSKKWKPAELKAA